MAGIMDLFQQLLGGAGGQTANNPIAAAAAQSADPWAGMREVGAQPTDSFAPLQMPELPAYNPLTDPTGPLARAGWIGSLMAQGQTREEAQLGRLGQGQAQAVHGIGARIQAGMNPQRAIMDFAGSPEGMDFFTSGGGFQDLANVVKGLTPAAVEPIKLSPNEQLVLPDGAGGYRPAYTAPNADVNKFTGFAELGNLSREEIGTLARAQLAKDLQGDMSASEAALARLVQEGKISQETADKNAAGLFKVQSVLDMAGNTTGYGVVDLTNNTVTMLPATQGTAGQLPKAGDPNYIPGQTPGTEDAALPDNGPQFEGMANPADIVDGGGPMGWLIEKLGAMGGNIAPSLAGGETAQKRNMLRRIMTDASQIASSGRVLATEMKDIRQLAETDNFWTNPIDVTNKLIGLHDAYDNAERKLNEQTLDPTGKNRGDALTELAAIRRAKANLPSRDSLLAKKSQLEAMQPGEQIGQQVGAVEKRLEEGGVVDPATAETEQQPQQLTYDNADSLQADWQAGKLRKGQTVILNGREFTVNTDYKTKK